jgi:5-(carboxyamino)imidazole ribonucleotide mutase
MPTEPTTPLVAIVMGSKSDWDTMSHADATLTEFGVVHECHVMSAHRTPRLATEFASGAADGVFQIIMAAAGGAAHLAGVLAAHTTLPVLGVPMKSDALNGMDSLLSTVQMPAGIPVATLAIGKPGAINAALFAIAILATTRSDLEGKLKEFRQHEEQKVRSTTLP